MKTKLQITTQTLIEECRKGDKEALNLFYLRFAPRMLSVIHHYISDPKDAEDILHDGFIVGLTRLDSLRDPDKVELWLASIMKNLSLRFLQEQDMSQILHDIPEVEDTPEIEEILDLNTLESLIAKLPAGYQRVFRLAILEHKTHKEIGALLGIAPNSSSSQLFHAKLMMRKLIKDYKLQTGLLTLLGAVLLIGIQISKRLPSEPVSQEILIAKTPGNNITTSFDNVAPAVAMPVKTTPPRTISKRHRPKPTEEIFANQDSLATPNAISDPVSTDSKEKHESHGAYFADTHGNSGNSDSHFKRVKAGAWSLNVSADPGLLSFNSLSNDKHYNLESNPGSSMDDPTKPGNGDETDDYAKAPRIIGNYQNYRDIAHTNSLPVAAALTASRRLNNVFSLETGVRYTYLHTHFETAASYANCHWHYIGIPLKINARLHSSHRFKLYTGAGASIDIPLYSNSIVTSSAIHPDLQAGRFSSPTVWSLSGNLGMSIKLSRKFDIFLEPTLQYHFDHNYTVPNTWTDNKWNFSLPLGIRLNM